MDTYDGYFDGAGMARMLLRFTREIEESLIRMRLKEASYEEEDK